MSLFNLLGAGGALAAGLDISKDIRKSGAEGAAAMQALGERMGEETAFRGYGVQTGLGRSTIDPTGSLNVGVGPEQGMLRGGMGMYGQAQTALEGALGDTAAREQEIFNRAMAMQEPGLQRAQAAQQAREFAMGRGGVRGSQFGGTAEDAAMARARAEATNAAAFQAMGQAQQEAMNQAQMGNIAGQLGLQGYQTAFTPLQQQLNALQVGQQAANMAQTGQLTGAGYLAQLGLGGLQSQINADLAAGQLYGNLVGAGTQALGGISGSGGSIWDDVKQLLGL
jgi:hypothetical protein